MKKIIVLLFLVLLFYASSARSAPYTDTMDSPQLSSAITMTHVVKHGPRAGERIYSRSPSDFCQAESYSNNKSIYHGVDTGRGDGSTYYLGVWAKERDQSYGNYEEVNIKLYDYLNIKRPQPFYYWHDTNSSFARCTLFELKDGVLRTSYYATAFSYDLIIDGPIFNSDEILCESGTVFNEIEGTCSLPSCPEGYQYDAERNRCYVPQCSTGENTFFDVIGLRGPVPSGFNYDGCGSRISGPPRLQKGAENCFDATYLLTGDWALPSDYRQKEGDFCSPGINDEALRKPVGDISCVFYEGYDYCVDSLGIPVPREYYPDDKISDPDLCLNGYFGNNCDGFFSDAHPDFPLDDFQDPENGGNEPGISDKEEHPSWWETDYEDGFEGVWLKNKQALDNTNFVIWLNSWSFSNSGSCPVFSFDFSSLGFNVNSFSLTPPCYLWDVLRAIFMFTSVLTFRKLVFGG